MLTPAKRFEDLLVWQKSHQIVLHIYRLTRCFPKEELYGLTSQFRRAVISVPANIAEGFAKRTRAEKSRFMNIARASVEEARYYVILGRDLGYHSDGRVMGMLEEVGRMLDAYSRSILAKE